MIANRWPDKVSDDVFILLEKWIETYSKSDIKSPYLPLESYRFVFTPFRNRKEQYCYRIDIMQGAELLCPPTGIRDFVKLKDLTLAFRALPVLYQQLIISYADPFQLLNDKVVFDEFLKDLNVKKREYLKLLEHAFVTFQGKLADRGLIRRVQSGEIRKWVNIAARIGKSIPTAIKLAGNKDHPLPVYVDGNIVYTYENLIKKWEKEEMQYSTYEMKNRRRNKLGAIKYA